MKKFYVYIDFTVEPAPRAFYVGKGCKRRKVYLARNERQRTVAREWGQQRIVVYETYDESLAFAVEQLKIDEYHTFIHDPLRTVGTNYTQGGEGFTGRLHSEETKQVIKEKRKDQDPTRHQRVAQYTLDGKFVKVFYSISDAERETGAQNVVAVGFKTKSGKTRRSAGGFMWRRLRDDESPPEMIEAYKKSDNKKMRRVIQYDLQGNELARYSSPHEASEASGYAVTYINAFCKCQLNPLQAKKYWWAYELVHLHPV